MRTIEREWLGGWCMIAGALGGLVTMAFHPTGGERPALSLAVHALALAGVPALLYGGYALTRRLAPAGALAELALACFGVSAVSTVLAGSASGLIAPRLFARSAGLQGEALVAAGAVMHFNYALNQAFATLLVAASSVAIGLWSIEIVRSGLLRPSTGIIGCVVGAVCLGALLSGRLALDVHGFGAIVLGQAVWLVLVGAELLGSSRAAGDARAGAPRA